MAKEAQEIKSKTGYYISPYRLSFLHEITSKVIKLISDPKHFAITYTECELVLNMALDAIRKAKGE